MTVKTRFCCVLVVALLLSACASLPTTRLREPQINLLALEPLAAEGFEQRFLLHLKIANPNDQPLPITGMSYHLRVEGFNLVSGVAKDLPPVPAYDSVIYRLEAGTNLLNGLRFIEQMISEPKDQLSYEIEAVLDLDQLLQPDLNIFYSGEFLLKK